MHDKKRNNAQPVVKHIITRINIFDIFFAIFSYFIFYFSSYSNTLQLSQSIKITDNLTRINILI